MAEIPPGPYETEWGNNLDEPEDLYCLRDANDRVILAATVNDSLEIDPGLLPAILTLPGLVAERDDLRDAIRLILGRAYSIPWPEVSEDAVDSCLREIRQLKRVKTDE